MYIRKRVKEDRKLNLFFSKETNEEENTRNIRQPWMWYCGNQQADVFVCKENGRGRKNEERTRNRFKSKPISKDVLRQVHPVFFSKVEGDKSRYVTRNKLTIV